MNKLHSGMSAPTEFAAPTCASLGLAVALTSGEQRTFLGDPLPDWGQLGYAASSIDPVANRPRWLEAITDLNPEVILTSWSTPSLPLEWLNSPECALRYVCHLTGSVRNLVPRCFIERGGLVTNWGDFATSTVAEHALLLILATLRNLGRWSEVTTSTQALTPPRYLNTRTLFGRRVGLHGLGGVARALLLLLAPFGVTVFGYTIGMQEGEIRARGVIPCASLTELCAQSDVLVECEGLTPLTAGSLGANELRALPDGAVLVNISRGAIIDEAALLAEAATGRIRVALDVLQSEPPDPSHPILAIKDAIWSPHIAGPTVDQYPECGVRALANLRRYTAGLPSEAVVTLGVYDRAT